MNMQNENKNYEEEAIKTFRALGILHDASTNARLKIYSFSKEQLANDEGFKNAIDDIVTSSKQAAEFYNYITDSNYF